MNHDTKTTYKNLSNNYRIYPSSSNTRSLYNIHNHITYKEQFLKCIARRINQLEELIIDFPPCPLSNKAKKEINILKEVHNKAKLLHGNHFIPKRFPSAKFLSIKLSLESINYSLTLNNFI